MRNRRRPSGVYTTMLAAALFLALSAVAQAQPLRQQDPLDAAIQAVWQAQNGQHFEEAAAARERARSLLQSVPVDSPRYGGWAQQVAQIYQAANWNAQARAILQEALARTASLGDSQPSRITLLSALGNSWQQDGNLLKAVGYLEQAAAAQATAPSVPASLPAARIFVVSGKHFSYGGYSGGGYSGAAINAYVNLANLYRQLGRPDAVAAVTAKIRVLAASDESALARFYEQNEQLDDAAAIYKKVADQSADPQAKANALQSLANVQSRQERFADAAASIQQAIAAVESSDQANVRAQATWMKQNLAGYLRQAGRLDQADQVYQQLVQQSRGGRQENQMLVVYAQYLADTQRAAQGASVLQDYLAGGASVDQPQRANALFQLANIARGAGDSKHADEYFQAAQALQPSPPQSPAGQISTGEELRKAQTAANRHRWDEAYGLALHVLDTATQATDGQQVAWNLPQVARILAANKETARAEHLFQRLFALTQTWKAGNIQPLMAVAQNYVSFLMNQPDRLSDVPAAIERYRDVLIEANGPDSGRLAEPLRTRLEFERAHSQLERADASARELLELQESLSGNTSEPYLGDLQTVARLYEIAGDCPRALPLFRKAVEIADLVTPNNDLRRSQTRMDAALVLARLGQFDEAETLAAGAVAMQPTPTPPAVEVLKHIRQMKQAALIDTQRHYQ